MKVNPIDIVSVEIGGTRHCVQRGSFEIDHLLEIEAWATFEIEEVWCRFVNENGQTMLAPVGDLTAIITEPESEALS